MFHAPNLNSSLDANMGANGSASSRQFGLDASGPVGKLAKTLTFGLLFSVILSSAEAAAEAIVPLMVETGRSCLYARRHASGDRPRTAAMAGLASLPPMVSPYRDNAIL
jgi:hypothetical protein